MIALAFIFLAFVLIAAGLTAKRYGDSILAEVLAVEQRQIERERARGLDANTKARWVG